MRKLLAIVIFSLCFGLGTPTTLSAHDWYPPERCSGHDCRVAHENEIIETPGGYHVVPTGEFFHWKAARPSPDGKFHRCLQNPKDIKSKTLCIFTVVGGS